MKRIKIKLLCLMLAVGMFGGTITACSKSDKVPTKTPAKTTTKDGKKVTEFSMFVNYSWYWTDKWAGIIPDQITKATGVKLNITRAADENQLGLMIASNDLPDLIYDSANLSRLADEKYSYSYDDLVAKYAPDWKMAETNAEQYKIAKTYSKDDKAYFLLNQTSSNEDWKKNTTGSATFGSVVLRQDILDKLGNPALKTMDDLMSVFEQVKKNYPDYSVLTLDPDWLGQYFANNLGVPGGETYKTSDNKLKDIVEHPDYKTYLKYMNDMYRKGILKAENFAAKNAEETRAIVSTGKNFAYTWCGAAAYRVNPLVAKSNPSAKYMNLLPLGGDKTTLISASAGWSGTFVTKNNKDPETAIKFLKFMASVPGERMSEWGQEGKEYTMTPEGYPKFNADFLASSAGAEKDFYEKYNPAFNLFGPLTIAQGDGWKLRNDNVDKTINPYNDVIRGIQEIQPEVALSIPKADTDEKVIYDKLVKMRKDMDVNIILSKTPEQFESNYNKMMKTAQTIGVQKLDDSMTKTLANLPK